MSYIIQYPVGYLSINPVSDRISYIIQYPVGYVSKNPVSHMIFVDKYGIRPDI